SDDARQVVRVAAVGGRRVTHDMLEAVAELPGPRLDDALRDAIDAHVLQLTSSGRGYTFRHALLAEAVYDDLLPGERVRLHAAYAAVLAARTDGRAAELARHARASHDLPTAYTASVAAGDEAMALALTSEAVHLVPTEPPTAFRARLLAMHARVALIMGQEVDAERTAREAVEVSMAVGCVPSATDARTTLAQLARRTVEPLEAA